MFGFGRRICPGRNLVNTSLFLNIAQSLAVFKVEKPRDDDCKEIEPDVKWTPGVVSHPVAY